MLFLDKQWENGEIMQSVPSLMFFSAGLALSALTELYNVFH